MRQENDQVGSKTGLGGTDDGSKERESLLEDRARIQGVLDGLQNVDGHGVETYGPDGAGKLHRNTTAETRAALERRLDDLDRKLSED